MSGVTSDGGLHPRSLIHNWISYGGILLAIISAMFIVGLVLVELNSPHGSAYMGVLTYMVLPPIFMAGLLLVPVGMGLENRRRRTRSAYEAALHPPFPRVDLNQRRHQQLFVVWAIGTLGVVAILGVVSYQSFEYMESVEFCGDVCHTVMQPEKVAYLDSPHARVTCTACHIGPGASFYVRSKLSGAAQVLAVATNSYPQPIETPIENLRPARETCEQCHWPEKFYGDKIVTHTRFQPDEQNSVQKTSLVVKTGGGSERAGISAGIHWHMDPRNEIDYVALDRERQEIAWVRARTVDGRDVEYFSDEHSVSEDELRDAEIRKMDCLDCHNRPTHVFYDADEAVDRAMAASQIDASLPFAKKIGVELISREYSSHEEAKRTIAAEWEQYYRDNYGDVYAQKADSVRRGAEYLVDAYTRNVFPQMNVTWGTYVNNIGHQKSLGCFRCHDGKHKSEDGQVIRNDCTLCHSLPVQGEPAGLQVSAPSQPSGGQGTGSTVPAAPSQSTAAVGHPWPLAGKHATLACASCHTSSAKPDPTCSSCHSKNGGGLHEKTVHSQTSCDTCHKKPGESWTATRESCYTCHADRTTHFPDQQCGTCHGFKGGAATLPFLIPRV